MKKYVLMLLLLVLVCGCGADKSKDKLISALEDEGFEYNAENGAYSRTAEIENGMCVQEIFIDDKLYSSVCVSEIKEYNYIMLTQNTYDWGINYLDGTMKGSIAGSEKIVHVVIDDTGNSSCNGEEDLCNGLQTSLINGKKYFLNIVDNADLELEDIQ